MMKRMLWMERRQLIDEIQNAEIVADVERETRKLREMEQRLELVKKVRKNKTISELLQKQQQAE